MELTRVGTEPEIMVPIRCDVPEWMTAYVGVVDHPFHAVSSLEDGSFEIPGLPSGDYVLEAWHERYGVRTSNVRVGAGDVQHVEFTFR